MKRTDEVFKPALQGKKIPILTLDNKWHRLFTQAESNSQIEALVKQENELLMRQGKLNTDIKEIRKLKKKLMEGIVSDADQLGKAPNKKTEKKLEESKRLINECNEKLEAASEELRFLPDELDRVNYQLMLVTMEACYEFLHENSKEIEEIDAWIKTVRVELKKKVIRKQEKEIKNHDLYAYMHDIFGADVIEIFDMKYNPEEKHPKKSAGGKKQE